MRTEYLKKLSDDRIWRVRELSDLRLQYENSAGEREKNVTSKSIVVLCYAHWEGYCASCVNIFIDYLESSGLKYDALPIDFLLGANSAALSRYRDKSDNLNSRLELIKSFAGNHRAPFKDFDRTILLPRSNLNFERLRSIFTTSGLDLAPFQKHRIKLDKELVAWRHQIAHGQMFTLDNSKVVSHTQFSEELMFITKDAFEDAIYKY